MSAVIRLRLYVVGSSLRSTVALQAVQALCQAHPDRVSLEVLDVLENPLRADDDRIMATPCLLRLSPEPKRRVFGDLSDHAALVGALGLDLDLNGEGGVP